nr:elongation of very long chain fatty acids protein AAEL008004-like [Procambarus clarkii]XP_045608806.1 elongation of very long chain fatty acids protein AAEL008004-like [Procambarus clarkii]
MASSHSTADSVKGAILQREDELTKLKKIGMAAAVVTALSYGYGEMTIARTLSPDPRQESWLLMTSPLPTLFATFVYIAASTWWGPLYMKHRAPFSGLRNVMMAYNAIQVVYSAWMFYEGGMAGWFGDCSVFCQACDFSDDPKAVRMMHCCYWYYFSKHVDFIDTLFFVLHKKNSHISLLHMTHHSLMPVSTWYGVRYYPGGHNTLFGFLNCFVHVVMYSYYLLAAMGPRVRPFLWWKKYLTGLQIVQFIIVILQALLMLFIECEAPLIVAHWVGVVAIGFLALFADFFYSSYTAMGTVSKED